MYKLLNKHFTKTFTLLTAVLFCFNSYCQHYSVQCFDISKGLSHNSVRSIIQDHDGFMWIGTYDGLNRFDGYDFKTYRNSLNDTTSITHNFIYTVHEDKNFNIWVGTGQGLCVYDRVNDNFKPVYYCGQSGRKYKVNVAVNYITSDASGTVYIGTNGLGLLVYKPGADAAIKPVYTNSEKSNNNNVSFILINSETNEVYLIDPYGLSLLNSKENSISNKIFINEPLSSVVIHNNRFWISSGSGIYIYDKTNYGFLTKYTNTNSELINNNIRSLSIAQDNKLWIGTVGNGIVTYDFENKRFNNLENQSGQELYNETIYSIFEDKNKRMWIATREGGVKLITPQKHKFETVKHVPYKENTLTGNFVSTFYEDSNGKLWIGTEGGGLSIWDRNNNSFKNFKGNTAGTKDLSYHTVSNIKKDHLNNIWIGTFGGGINKYDPATNSFRIYKCYNPVKEVDNNYIWQFFEDHLGVLWVSTFSNGKLYQLDRKKDVFQVFDQELYDINYITEDSDGQMWGGNSHQLIKIDRDRKNHTLYEIGKPVRSIYTDVHGNFWIGSEGGGLILFDKKAGTIKERYSTTDGLCNNAVLCILEDNSGYLWLSTFNGLSRFNINSKTFENYYQEDGLQSDQFLYSSALKLKNGEMVFGGVKGFNLFNPDHISIPSKHTPPLFITNVDVNSVPIALNSRYVTGTSKNNIITDLKVPYNQASLSFKFAALEFFEPAAIKYAYFMEGFDTKWNYTDKYRYANYSNLREGTYKLRIKTTRLDGSWADNEVITNIIVLPPWYRTWWAYSVYVLILLSLIKFYTDYQRKQERLKYRLQLAEVNIEKEKELHEKKLAFFTNISHEFRAPLSLIITPIKDFLNSKDSQVDTKELIIVYRNARRLLSLVDQLLLFRKSDVDQIKLSKFGAVSFCKEVYACFVQQAKIKNIAFDFVCETEEFALCADKEKIEICLFNLLSNAFKYTPNGGTIQFIVQQNQQTLTVTVIDTGKGIDPSVGNRIFENFYQVNENGNTAKGFGIGLHLVKQISEQHHGNVMYTSTPGKGSAFVLEIPIGCDKEGAIIPDHTDTHLQFMDEMVDAVVEETDTRQTAQADMEVVTDKKTILLVDDNNELRKYIKGIFAGTYIVMEADSAEGALEILNDTLPDLIITDIVMQGKSGLELCEVIKKDSVLAHIPVILLTSSTSAEIKLKGIEGGADDFITKPFDKEILTARVINLLKSRNHMHRHFYNQITLKIDDYKISSDLKEFLDACIAITEKHLQDPDFNVKTLAEELDMSHSALYRKVKLVSGKSVTEFIRFIKLRKAAQLLINTESNISESAYLAGFNDMGYFRTQFKKVFGINPSKYAKQFKDAGQKPYKVNKK